MQFAKKKKKKILKNQVCEKTKEIRYKYSLIIIFFII